MDYECLFLCLFICISTRFKKNKNKKTKYFVSMAINIQIREECWWLPWCNLITIPHYNLGIWTFTCIQIHFWQAMHMCVYHNIRIHVHVSQAMPITNDQSHNFHPYLIAQKHKGYQDLSQCVIHGGMMSSIILKLCAHVDRLWLITPTTCHPLSHWLSCPCCEAIACACPIQLNWISMKVNKWHLIVSDVWLFVY